MPHKLTSSRIFSPPLFLDSTIITDAIRLDVDSSNSDEDWYEIDAVCLNGWIHCPPPENCCFPPIVQDSLGAHLASLVESDLFSDVKIILDDGHKVAAHKNILAPRCEYFKTLLSGGWKESSQEEIALKEISYPIFQLLLRHLYTDCVEIPADYLIPLFHAANKFNLNKLRAQCVDEFKFCLNTDNVVPILSVVIDCDELRTACKEFILCERNYPKVIESPHFISLPPSMLVELMRSKANKVQL